MRDGPRKSHQPPDDVMQEQHDPTSTTVHAQDLLHTFLESMGAGAFAVSDTQGLIYCNEQARTLLGVDPERLELALATGELDARALDDGQDALRRALAGQTFGATVVALARDEETRWLEVTSSPWSSGELEGALVLLRDVTQQHEERVALERRARRYERMFTRAPEALTIVCRHTGRMIEANDAAAELLGASEDHRGKPLETFGFEDELARALAERAGRDQEAAFPEPVACSITRRGEERALLAFPKEIRDESRTNGALFVAFHDVTDRANTLAMMERYHEQFLRAQQLTSVGSWELEAPGGDWFWSDQLFRLHGLEPGATPDTATLLETIAADDRALVSHMFDDIVREPRAFELTYRVETDEGTRFIEAMGEPRQTEAGVRIFGTSQDVTERVQVEYELRAYAEQLEMANQDLQEFACVASHDLQEPLRKVIAFGDRLRARHGDQLDARGHDYLDRMQCSAARMRTLIEDLLELSRVATHSHHTEEFDARSMIDELVDMFEVRLETCGGAIEVEVTDAIEGDPVQIRQLLQNLISNALKFHQHGKPPVVRVYGQRIDLPSEDPLDLTEQTYYQLVVEDEGIGMPQEMCECIFEPFKRLHGRSSKYEGSGIGLAICRKIVERHGGSVRVDSARDLGTRFTILLPVGALSI